MKKYAPLRKHTLFLPILLSLFFLLPACQAKVTPAPQAEELDVRGTLDAIGHTNADDGAQADMPDAPPGPLDAQSTPLPALDLEQLPTATVYVPEGQLFFYNFEDVQEGIEREIHSGITLHKLKYGFEIKNASPNEYFMGTGVTDHPDGNISTFVKSISAPTQTTLMLFCRAQTAAGQADTEKIANAYIAYLRMDGAARLVKRANTNDTVLVDWQTGITMNTQDMYTNVYLLCDGSRLLFIVNGQTAFDVNDNNLTQGDFGIGVDHLQSGSASIVQFDKIMVYEP